MKKEIRQISEDCKTVQVTIADERWYIKTETDANGKVLSMKEYPSVTWIADHYPKGVGFYMWLANQGWDNAESNLHAAGNRGSKVHQAIGILLLGNELKMDDKLRNNETGEDEAITLEEWEAIMSFSAWHNLTKPKMLANELAVFNDELMYAGTADYICEIEGEKWLIDFKSGKDVWPSYELQVSAYAHALPPELKPDRLAILQVGYKRNKAGWKLTELEDKFDLFQAAQQIWRNECSTVKVFKKDYPVSISLSLS